MCPILSYQNIATLTSVYVLSNTWHSDINFDCVDFNSCDGINEVRYIRKISSCHFKLCRPTAIGICEHFKNN